MMADFPKDLLDRPAIAAATAIALAYLEEAAAAAARMHDPRDAEALHDFRVAIRRLRVTVRAYPDLQQYIPKKHRKRLRKLARATSAARDAEVQIAWFRERAARFTPAERAAVGPLRARLRARKRRAAASSRRKLKARFGKLERKLRRCLLAVQSGAAHERRFRAAAAAALQRHAAELHSRLAAPTHNTPELHATRIAAKRLRYVLEPVAPVLHDGARLVERLKNLQDLLGELRDSQALEAALQEEGEATATAAHLVHGEVASLVDKMQVAWSKTGPNLEREVAVAARLLQPAAKPPRAAPKRRRLRRAVVRDFSG